MRFLGAVGSFLHEADLKEQMEGTFERNETGICFDRSCSPAQLIDLLRTSPQRLKKAYS